MFRRAAEVEAAAKYAGGAEVARLLTGVMAETVALVLKAAEEVEAELRTSAG